jgi:riboflavin kinase/FMN adenylyltransferase
MKVIRNPEEFPHDYRDGIATIGNFDGIHLGHQGIFRKLIQEAHEQNRKAVVITFDPHPKKVLRPERRPFILLTPVDEKLKLMEQSGIDAVVLITFTPEFAKTSAQQFVRHILWENLRIKKLFVGYDYGFGKGKEGNAEFLRARGRELGFDVEEISAVTLGDIIVSSTKIRLSILDGDVKLARTLLGRPYNVYGTVVRGHKRGTEMGVPTANIQSEKVIPECGVYAVFAEVEGEIHQGVINLGFNPTFGNDTLSVEVHLFDFKGDIYGRNIEIFFIERLRNEMKFENAEKLVEQIRKDIARAREILNADTMPHVRDH